MVKLGKVAFKTVKAPFRIPHNRLGGIASLALRGLRGQESTILEASVGDGNILGIGAIVVGNNGFGTRKWFGPTPLEGPRRAHH